MMSYRMGCRHGTPADCPASSFDAANSISRGKWCSARDVLLLLGCVKGLTYPKGGSHCSGKLIDAASKVS